MRIGPSVPSVDAVQLVGRDVYWIEGRPGGDVLVRSRGSGGGEDVLPASVTVASSVHEYGGGAYLPTVDAVWFVRANDQQIWRATAAGLCAITASPPQGEHRYADLRICRPGLVVAVRERHHNASVTNELVMVPADRSAAPWQSRKAGISTPFPGPVPMDACWPGRPGGTR